MSPIALAALAATTLAWFVLAFFTRSWARQWMAALVAGLALAWWRHGAMREVAASLEIEPMSFTRFAAITVATMLVLASVGMGLRWLLQKSRAR